MFRNLIFPLLIVAALFSLFNFANAGSVKDTLTETVTLKEQATTPAPPASGQKQLFVDSDGKAKLQDSTGALSDVGGSGPEPWAATTDYTTDKLVIYLDVIYRALSDFTSGATFTPANWAEVGKTSDKVVGPGPTTTDGCLAAFDGASGYTIKGTPVCVDVSGNLSGVNDLDTTGNITAGGYLTNGTVTIGNSAINSTGGLNVDPDGDFTFKDSNDTDVKVGTNNAELSNLLKYPSFEESISEWSCDYGATNCTLTQESGGIHPLTSGKFLRMAFANASQRVTFAKTIPATTEALTGYAACNFKASYSGAQLLPVVGASRKWQYQSAIPNSSTFQFVYVTFPIPVGTTQIAGQVDGLGVGTIDVDGECSLGVLPPTQVGFHQQGEQVVFAKNTTGCDIGIASDVTPLCWAEINDPYGMWDGTTFTPDETAVYSISFGASFTSAASRTFDLWRNTGSGYQQYLMFSVGTSSTDGAGVFTTKLEAGVSYQVRVRTGGTLAVSTVTHTLAISKFQSMKTASGLCTGGELACENSFTATVTSGGTIISQSTTNPWITNVSKDADGLSAVTLASAQTLGITENMMCSCGQDVPGGRTTAFCGVYNQGLTSFSIQSANHVAAEFDSTLTITCTKRAVDKNKSKVIVSEVIRPKICVLTDQRSAGSNGGSASAGVWNPRVLNTSAGDCSFVSLTNGTTGTDGTANIFNITQSGTYQMDCSAPTYYSAGSHLRLMQDPSGTPGTVANGNGRYSANATGASDVLNEVETHPFHVEANTQFQLQHFLNSVSGAGTASLGVDPSSGVTRYFGKCKITKLE